MATTGNIASTSGTQLQAGAQKGQTKAVLPFARATRRHKETFDDRTLAGFPASLTQVGDIDILAFGFLRNVVIEVQATGGTSGAPSVFTADAPFNFFSGINVKDTNGAYLYGPLDGYNAMLADKYGGLYPGLPWSDPRSGNFITVTATGAGSGNFSFELRIPAELIQRSGLGNLPNTNAAAAYKLQYFINPSTVVYTTAPTTTPTSIRIRSYGEYNTQPPSSDIFGNQQAQIPPNMGTLQFWTQTQYQVSAGANRVRLLRVGNYARNYILVYRNASNVRLASTQVTDPMQIWLDGFLLDSFSVLQWQSFMAEKFNAVFESTAGASTVDGVGQQDTGVWVYPFTDDLSYLPGNELRSRWLPTLESTRLEWLLTLGTAGTLTVLTNDVSPMGDVFSLATL